MVAKPPHRIAEMPESISPNSYKAIQMSKPCKVFVSRPFRWNFGLSTFQVSNPSSGCSVSLLPPFGVFVILFEVPPVFVTFRRPASLRAQLGGISGSTHPKIRRERGGS
jgi:hypothetical protein